MFSKFFIDRPIFSSVISIIIVIAGLVTLRTLPIAQYPDITPPTVMVSAYYPGASAETVAQTVGVPIEQQVNGVENMMYMSSSSSSDGKYSLTVTFELGTDIDDAAIMVQNRVNLAEANLPSSVKQQGVNVLKRSPNQLMFVVLDSDLEEYDGLFLSNYANINIVNELARLKGVGDVHVFGAAEYAMRVWLDPEIMRIRDITPDEVLNMIKAQNMEVSAGSVGAPPTSGNMAFQYSISTKGRLVDVEEFGNIIIRTIDNGEYLRLKDIAKIELGSQSYSVTTTMKGEEIAAIGINQMPGSNALDVAKEVKNKVEELQQFLPEGINMNIVMDNTKYVTASIDEVLVTIAETTLLVILVMFLFLQNIRAVIIPALTIPISLLGTLAVMRLLGFSINLLTLFGLVLAIAIVVDDAIVVVENSSRLIQSKKRLLHNNLSNTNNSDITLRREAVTEAMREIEGPIISIVLVLLAVFIPTAFIGGITGELYKQFALTIATATIISGFISLIFTPAMCVLFLKEEKWNFKWFNNFYDKTLGLYVRVVKSFLRKPVIALGSFVIISALTAFIFFKLPNEFLPEEDLGYFMISVQLPNSSSLERTEKVTADLSKMLDKYPEIDTYLVINGFSFIKGGNSSNEASMFVMLKDWDERKGKDKTAMALIDRINAETSEYQEANIFALNPPSIPGLGAAGGLSFVLEDRNNLGTTELENAVATIMENYHQEPALMYLQSQFQGNSPQYFLNINRDKIGMMGLQLNQVFDALSSYMGSTFANDFVKFNNIYQVIIQANPNNRNVIEDILKLSVENSYGEMVPFSAFCNIDEKMGQTQINRYNLYPAANITAIAADGYSSSEAMTALENLTEDLLGNNFGYEWTSVAYQEKISNESVSMIFILAIILVILVLAAMYESWTNPFAVILSVPLALMGVVVGCIVMFLPISIYSQIGIILLIALSAKNAILIVEFAVDYRKAGLTIGQSALQAGRVRLRPILITSLTFVLGVLPLLFATGAGAESRVALGTAVVFGMFTNTIFGTLFVPNFFRITEGLQDRIKK
ncbi:MAG: multidrug efflux RND transporter permease subunit [Bacteroidales bacterium]|nr:multidrug efflux RND transporter permease subunit [Bacteroidales bacterium]